MSSVFVIIREIGPKQSAQMVFAEDDEMIGTFAPNAFMELLHKRVLSATLVGCQHLFYAHRFDALAKPISVNTISIPKQISGCSVPRERLENLSRGPFGRGIRRYVEVNDSTPRVPQDDKHEQQPKSNGRHDDKVHTNHVQHVVLDEGSPSLRCRLPFASAHQSRHGSLGDLDSKFEQLAVNLGCTPERIGIGHL